MCFLRSYTSTVSVSTHTNCLNSFLRNLIAARANQSAALAAVLLSKRGAHSTEALLYVNLNFRFVFEALYKKVFKNNRLNQALNEASQEGLR